jgi:hypothetical protein
MFRRGEPNASRTRRDLENYPYRVWFEGGGGLPPEGGAVGVLKEAHCEQDQ